MVAFVDLKTLRQHVGVTGICRLAFSKPPLQHPVAAPWKRPEIVPRWPACFPHGLQAVDSCNAVTGSSAFRLPAAVPIWRRLFGYLCWEVVDERRLTTPSTPEC